MWLYLSSCLPLYNFPKIWHAWSKQLQGITSKSRLWQKNPSCRDCQTIPDPSTCMLLHAYICFSPLLYFSSYLSVLASFFIWIPPPLDFCILINCKLCHILFCHVFVIIIIMLYFIFYFFSLSVLFLATIYFLFGPGWMTAKSVLVH